MGIKMNNNDIDLLIRQIQNVILNKPLEMSDKLVDTSDELQKLQDAIYYLSSCLIESNQFLQALSEGDLDPTPPGRHNFIAGYLKELHSILKHLTWQTTQVAHGDYNQRVHFLGEFSDSFNLMVKQLEEREIKLNEKSNALTQSMNLLISVMDTQSHWIIVMDYENHEIIYTNQSANEHFYNMQENKILCKKDCPILEKIKFISNIDSKCEYEFYCSHKRYMKVISYPIEWNDKKAIVHYISDITEEKESKRNLSNLAYTDELTGTYNRRYCNEIINDLIHNKQNFSLVLIDLDNLKHVNDTFGHVTGDEYILMVIQAIKNNIRNYDVLCRIGGDEFVVIFKNCSEEIAVKKMNKVHDSILQIKKDYILSISYGITFVSQDMNLTPDDIIELSDTKMYEFKKNYKK